LTTLRVLTFNVWQLPVVSLVGPRRRRAQLALELIKRVGPDVVVLNEAFGLSPAGRIVTGLRAVGYHATDQLGRGGETWSSTSGRRGGVSRLVGGGVYVLSRYPIEQRHQHVYQTRRPGTSDAWSAKGVALVALTTPGGRVWLAGTHLQSNGNWHHIRLGQLAELRALVDRTVSAGEPVLIAGDLNIPFHERHTDHLDANRVLSGRIEPDGPIHEFTFDGAENPLVRRADRRYRSVLDYIGQLNGEGNRPPWTIHTETLGYESGREISDHFPVLGVATLTGAIQYNSPRIH
jgi:endonuclease/exonuclease/phosphatase family metal-dependent hydrolase